MRALLVAGLLAGCGRLGFDGGAPAPDGATHDAPTVAVPAVCNPRGLASAPISQLETVTRLRAVPLSSGHALTIATSGGRIHMVAASAGGALGTFHLPFDGGYTLFGLSQLADTPHVYVETGGDGYIKILEPSWDAYITGPSADPVALDPPQAPLPGGQAAMLGLMFGTTMQIEAIDADGVATGVTADYAPTAVGGAFASVPSGVRVVADVGDGTCETFVVEVDGKTKDRHTFGPCKTPVLAALDDKHAAIVHQTTPGAYEVYLLPDDPMGTGTGLPLAASSAPRVAVIDGAAWIGYRTSGGTTELARVTPGGLVVEPIPDVRGELELTPSALFWVDGTTVHVGEPCVR